MTLQDFVHETTMSSQETPLAACSLLLSHKQEVFNNHPAQFPVTHIQQGTHELRDEVLSSVGAQDIETNGYQMFDQNDVEFYWERDDPDVDAVFAPGLVTTFLTAAFEEMEMGSSAENPILLNEVEDKNSPPTTPVSERPTLPPALLINCPSATRTGSVPHYVFRNMFQ